MKTRLFILMCLTVFFTILPAAAVDNIEDFYGTWYGCVYENENGDCVQEIMFTIEPDGNFLAGELHNHQLTYVNENKNWKGASYWKETENGIDLFEGGEKQHTIYLENGELFVETAWYVYGVAFPLYKTERSMDYYGMKAPDNLGEITEEDYIRTWYLDASWDEEAEGYRYALENDVRSSLSLRADHSFDYAFESDEIHFEREGYRWEMDDESVVLTFAADGEDGTVYTGKINSYGYLVLRDEADRPAMIFWDQNPFNWIESSLEGFPKDEDVTEDDFCGGYRVVAQCDDKSGCFSLSKAFFPPSREYVHYAIGDAFVSMGGGYGAEFANGTLRAFSPSSGAETLVEKRSDKYMIFNGLENGSIVTYIAQRYFPINFD